MSKERVLDIGVGSSNHLGIYGKAEYEVTGIDPRLDVVDRARGNMRGEFVVGVGEQLPFPNESFDRVFSLMSLEHVDNPSAVLSEANRVLTPNGRITIDVPHPRYEAVMSRISKRYCGELHERVFDPNEIRELVERAGFNIDEMSPRMWHAAVGFSVQWLRARLSGKLEFDHDTGEFLNKFESNEKPARFAGFRDRMDRLLWLSENRQASPKRYVLLSPLRAMNHVYPWATYIEATKI